MFLAHLRKRFALPLGQLNQPNKSQKLLMILQSGGDI